MDLDGWMDLERQGQNKEFVLSFADKEREERQKRGQEEEEEEEDRSGEEKLSLWAEEERQPCNVYSVLQYHIM